MDTHTQRGLELLNHAKADRQSRKRSADNDLNAACLDGAKFIWAKPVSVSSKTPVFRRKPKIKCWICGDMGGEMIIEGGKAYCRADKQAIQMSQPELNEYLTKRRKGSKC